MCVTGTVSVLLATCVSPVSDNPCACVALPYLTLSSCVLDVLCDRFGFHVSAGNWLKRSSLSGLTDGVEDLLDISSVDRLSFIRQSSKVREAFFPSQLEEQRA